MPDIQKTKKPIIICGLGGSGTRVVAECLIRSGVYLGRDLNNAYDHLLFTYLFKLPNRFSNKSIDERKEVEARLALHEHLLLGRRFNVLQTLILLAKAAFDQVAFRYYKTKWILKRLQAVVQCRSIHPDLWGWKEPHTIFFMKELQDFYPSGKFILVVRNGLDMAYSKNLQQFRYWRQFIDMDEKQKGLQNKFEFWYRMNKSVVSSVSGLHIIKFEELCENPSGVLARLFDFINIDSRKVPQEIWNLPKLPPSVNRYAKHPTDWISADIKKKLSEFGYNYA